MKQGGSFWDRRKAAGQAEAAAEAEALRRAEEERKAAALAEKDDAEILAEMGLPEPEAMQQGDDFTAFMSRDVPERLRRRALRTLWRSNPVLACVDGLNDYDGDFTVGATGSEPIRTAYQVGKGMLYHLEEMARQAAPVTEVPETVTEEAEEMVAVAEAVEDADLTAGAAAGDEAAPEQEALAPRRMRFRFEEARA